MRLFSWSWSEVSSTICLMCCFRSFTCSSSLWQCRSFSNTWTRGRMRSESTNDEAASANITPYWISTQMGRITRNKRWLGAEILAITRKVLFSSMFHQKSCLLREELWRKETTKQQQKEHLTSGCVTVLGQFLEERIKKKKITWTWF